MLSDKQKRIVQLAIILTGIILGGLLLAPLLNNNREGSSFLGGFVRFLVSIAIFPDSVKGMFENQNEKRAERVMEEYQLGFYRYLTHPTQIPFIISLLLFVVLLVLMVILDYLKIKISFRITQVAFSVMAFLWGLSGLLMIIRKEFIDKRGRRYLGGWAILNGVLFLLMGWGSIIFLLLVEIFNW